MTTTSIMSSSNFPQLPAAFQKFQSDLQSAGVNMQTIAQQLQSNGQQITPQTMNQAILSAVKQSDPNAYTTIQQDITNLPTPTQNGLGFPPPNFQQLGAFQNGSGVPVLNSQQSAQFKQLFTDLQSAGITPQTAQQLGQQLQSSGQQPTPQNMNQAILSYLQQNNPSAVSQIQSDFSQLPPPPQRGSNSNQIAFGVNNGGRYQIPFSNRFGTQGTSFKF